jgi:hypothetical protein
MRPALTIIELLVAIVVFTIGVLGLAGTAGLVAGRLADGERLTSAAHVARSVLDSLGAVPCDRVAAGTVSRGRVQAQWTVARDSVAARVDLVIGVDLRRARRRETYQLVVPCARD